MSFVDELKRLTQPIDDDDDDFYEGASEEYVPSQQKEPAPSQPAEDAQDEFESSFSAPAPAPSAAVKKKKAAAVKAARKNATTGAGGSIFGNFGDTKKAAAPPAEYPRQNIRPAKRRPAAEPQQVILFNPKDFDEAGELVTYITQGRSLVMALETIPVDTARRLLDFISGICFALNAKITPVSAKTYFITPENVDILDAQTLQNRQQDEQEEDI